MDGAILVTGGAGYIGAHACKALAAIGYTPIVYDNLTQGYADSVKWGPLEKGDIRDRSRLVEVMRRYDVRAVLHFAALAYVGESVEQPDRYYDINVTGSLRVLEAMREADIKSIVFSSSCATYGIPRRLPITETTPQNPINPYGFTKFAVERMITDFSRAYGIHALLLRYFNAAGADPDGELGERHNPETHAIPLAIRSALKIGPPFRILGDDYDTPDGTAIRDYIHVSDLADAHAKALAYLQNGGTSHAVNLATGHGVSVKKIVTTVEAITQKHVDVVIAPRREGDPPTLYANGSRAQSLLRWTPRFTDIEEIIATAVPQFAVPR